MIFWITSIVHSSGPLDLPFSETVKIKIDTLYRCLWYSRNFLVFKGMYEILSFAGNLVKKIKIPVYVLFFTHILPKT